ncbi:MULTISPECIES: hypothetical protein [Alistipes]|jgi:hypothetical protein|uniref:Uncharacterized protein n=1 Tax=Alistipes shahii WAL 8301 TaxID=717959 RepID=D4IK68_9BACT|nr:hypothetical protein [Alistipes shahii]UWN67483.1 hypothetical protein NQ492_11810 [Alistipes shahii WAL 8301]CBK63330.1 hypothetical protein AL1_07580 [Alistipes shahii WAL 8301]HJC52812.1 hypothetical protein [Candidatus Alistipes merdavium]
MTDKKKQYTQKTATSFRTFGQRADAPKTAEAVIPIAIIDQQGRNYTLRNVEGLQLRIDESLIIDNGLHIDAQAGKLLVPESLVRAWFEPIRRERQKREEQRLQDLFAESVPLIWRQRERILADPQLFGVRTPMRIRMAYVSMRDSGPYPLGVVVRAWTEYEERYTRVCPKCGGQMLIFSFSGSPLSGRSSHSATCTACGYQQRHVDEGSFGRLASPITRIAGQYRDLPKDDALPFEEAINLLQHL